MLLFLLVLLAVPMVDGRSGTESDLLEHDTKDTTAFDDCDLETSKGTTIKGFQIGTNCVRFRPCDSGTGIESFEIEEKCVPSQWVVDSGAPELFENRTKLVFTNDPDGFHVQMFKKEANGDTQPKMGHKNFLGGPEPTKYTLLFQTTYDHPQEFGMETELKFNLKFTQSSDITKRTLREQTKGNIFDELTVQEKDGYTSETMDHIHFRAATATYHNLRFSDVKSGLDEALTGQGALIHFDATTLLNPDHYDPAGDLLEDIEDIDMFDSQQPTDSRI